MFELIDILYILAFVVLTLATVVSVFLAQIGRQIMTIVKGEMSESQKAIAETAIEWIGSILVKYQPQIVEFLANIFAQIEFVDLSDVDFETPIEDAAEALLD